MKKNTASKLAIPIFIIFCLSLSITVLVTDSKFTSSLLKITSSETAQPVTRQLWDFFAFQQEVPNVFTPDEKSHLYDVRRLLWINGFLTIFTGFLLIRLMRFDPKSTAKNGTKSLIILFASSLLLPFDKLFLWFHCIFFPQGNFQFPSDSTLLTFYPSVFFTYYALAAGICTLLAASAMLFFFRKK